MTIHEALSSRWLSRVANGGLALALLTVLTPSAEAVRLQGSTVVLPVIAHNPGYLGSEWRTEVWIDNPYGNAGAVTLNFYPESGGSASAETSIEAYSALYFPDIVLNSFGMNDAKGMLIVTSPSTEVEVRARIYNTGSEAGEYGQAVMGLPTGLLNRQGHVGGVSTANGNRVSVGIANPTELAYEVGVTVKDPATGSTLYSAPVMLSPHQLIQFSDVATLWGLPASSNLIVSVNSGVNGNNFYAYVSVVRNDTGDATFLFGTSPNS